MIIDKSKLQPLLWAVVGAWRAGDRDLHLRTSELDQFLGEHTVEEVALDLLAEVERLTSQVKTLQSDANSWQSSYDEGRRMATKTAYSERDQLKVENEKMRSFLAEVSRTSGDNWAVMAARNLLEDVDHG